MKAEEIDCTGVESSDAGRPGLAQSGGSNHSARDLHDLIVGGHTLVPILDGTLRPYINLDNAASTPIARPVKDTVDRFLEWYAAVHRGSGFKSQLSSLVYEQSREIVAHFVGADLSERCLIFVRNATEAINRAANRIPLSEGDVVLSSLMEHHSNILAWRRRCAHIESISVDEFGAPILADLEERLRHNEGHVKLVALSGGSNVTGVIPDIKSIARITHAAGATLLVDAAQLAPHRPIDVGRVGDPESIDFLAFSAHKMYAPLGCGALIGPTSAFEGGVPDLVGGGTVLFVSEEEEMWGGPPDSEEAGSPNVVGSVAMASAARFLSETLGWEAVVQHERKLTSYALTRLNEIPGVIIYGPSDPALPQDRLGVIAFNLEHTDHQLTAAILSHEYGIGTRTGGFCAHPYLMRLFGLDSEHVHMLREEVSCGNRLGMPGAVRMSFGFYSSQSDVDTTVDALQRIQRGEWQGDYTQNARSGEYKPSSLATSPEGWFEI